jgi:hypothetical protein
VAPNVLTTVQRSVTYGEPPGIVGVFANGGMTPDGVKPGITPNLC